MKKLILSIFVIFSGVMITQAQYVNGDPTLTPEQNKILEQQGQSPTRGINATDYFIFGNSNYSSSNSLVLNGVQVPNYYQGWFLDDGSHTASNSNYICGFYNNQYYRNWHAYDLSNLSSYGITPPITSAVLRTQKFTSIPASGFAVWDLHSVTTAYSLINVTYPSGSAGGQAIFADLGTGTYYGNGTVDGSLPSSSFIETPLNSAAIADINNAIGSIFVIGGRSDDFLTDPPPTAVTLAATNLGGNMATLNGTVNANGTSTNVSFRYGTSSGNLTQTMVATPSTVTGSTVSSVSAVISGLTPGQTYYFQVIAENTNGAVVYGLEMSFVNAGSPLPVPISDWAIYLGIFLIAVFIVLRFRRRLA